MQNNLFDVLTRIASLLERLEMRLPPNPAPIDWQASRAFLWRQKAGRTALHPIRLPDKIKLEDLHEIEEQKNRITQNTRQFLNRQHANNVLLTGARGTGKSSLIKALLNAFGDQGLRLVEIEKTDLADLPELIDLLASRPERFIIFCDDLSFEEGEIAYKALKSVLDGSIASLPENVLIYATSNRRHLMPEYQDENLNRQKIREEIHPGEAIEEKVSLSERFGLWLSFYPMAQDEYLRICRYWLTQFGASEDLLQNMQTPALQWSLMRGARNGRVAWQFAKDFIAQTPISL